MDQIKSLFGTLSARQRWTVAIVAILVAAGLYGFQHWQQESGFRPLYGSLAAEDAASVVQKLKEEGVSYRLSSDGTTVSAPQERVAELRLEMAAAGLPKSGRIGFEIFDKANFGMTDFAERVNYQRALEGELERSVMSISQVEQARVHISFPQESVFTETKKPAKASVLVRLRAGAQLPEGTVPALTHLISSAVEGLVPEAVSVLDMRGNLLNRAKRTTDTNEESSEASLEYQRRVEQSLMAKLDSTLEPLVGAGRFRTAVSADVDMTSGEQSEENFDPTRSVMLNSQKTEDVTANSRPPSGIPGTASNLPDAAPRPAGSGETSRKTESVNYQSSRTVKRTVIPQGAIRRLSVSVLLDNEIHEEAGDNGKRTLAPPAPERLKSIHDLAAAAIGLNMERGDQLIVESLPFESSINLEPLNSPLTKKPVASSPSKPWYSSLVEMVQKNPKGKMIVGVAGGVVVLLLGGIVFAMRRAKKKRSTAKVMHTDSLPEFTGETKAALAQPASDTFQPSTDAPRPAVAALAAAPSNQMMIGEIRETVLREPEVSLGVLRGWLREEQL